MSWSPSKQRRSFSRLSLKQGAFVLAVWIAAVLALTCCRRSAALLPRASLRTSLRKGNLIQQSNANHLTPPATNTTGCGLSWVVLIGDSNTRGTFYSLAVSIAAKHPHVRWTEIGQPEEDDGKETRWRDVDVEYSDGFKLSLRFLTSVDRKLPAILANFSMLHGGHSAEVQPLPELARAGPSYPDVVLFTPGLWPLTLWSESELSGKMVDVWQQVAAIPKPRLRLVNLPEITLHHKITQAKVDAMNAEIKAFADKRNIPLLDAAAVAAGGSDGTFHLVSSAYDGIASGVANMLCWGVR